MSGVTVRVVERRVKVRREDTGAVVRVEPTRNALSLRGAGVPALPTTGGKKALLYDATGAAISWDKISASEIESGAAAAGEVLTAPGGGGAPSWQAAAGGVTDHGALTGLADDDHSQYHNDTRGDLRYPQLAHAARHNYGGADAIAGAGRLTRRHWLDPDPSAIDIATGIPSQEFLVDQTQAQLEAAGWVFTSDTAAKVSAGMMVIGSTAATGGWKGGYVPVSLSGNFSIVLYFATPCLSEGGGYYATPGGPRSDGQSMALCLVDTVGSVCTWVDYRRYANTGNRLYYQLDAAWPIVGGSYASPGDIYAVRVSRDAGTLWLTYARIPGAVAHNSAAAPPGWYLYQSVASARTYNRLYLHGYFNGVIANEFVAVGPLRRYA